MQNEECRTTATPAILRAGARVLSKLAVCDDCKVCWPVAHVDPRTDILVPHELGPLVHLWLERHLFCESVRFCAANEARGAGYDPMDADGGTSGIVGALREEWVRRRTVPVPSSVLP